MILLCQIFNSIIFLGADFGIYIEYFADSALQLFKKIAWTLLPVIAWCMFCSSIAKRNPFLLAFLVPILFVLIDYLFFKGTVSEFFIINRLTGVSQFSISALLSGIVFSAICIAAALFKRAQKV